MARKWLVSCPPVLDVGGQFPSERKTYEFIQSLARAGYNGVVRVSVDEGRGRGWELFEEVDLGELAQMMKGLT